MNYKTLEQDDGWYQDCGQALESSTNHIVQVECCCWVGPAVGSWATLAGTEREGDCSRCKKVVLETTETRRRGGGEQGLATGDKETTETTVKGRGEPRHTWHIRQNYDRSLRLTVGHWNWLSFTLVTFSQRAGMTQFFIFPSGWNPPSCWSPLTSWCWGPGGRLEDDWQSVGGR